MRNLICSVFLMVALAFATSPLWLACQPKPKSAHDLIVTMVEAAGGRKQLDSLQDVEYKYTYIGAEGNRDVSLERYVFDGEKSWARYLERGLYALPNLRGELVQGYNGRISWATLNGKLIEDPKVSKLIDFPRKTNYFWFTMMFKMLDPGMSYELLDKRSVDGVDYDVVKIGYHEGIGDVQDTYILYINPRTHLVDQFLFTVLDFDIKEPILMKVEYEDIAGLKLPSIRKGIASDWEGNIRGEKWSQQLWTEIKFNNGFDPGMFERPVADTTEFN